MIIGIDLGQDIRVTRDGEHVKTFPALLGSPIDEDVELIEDNKHLHIKVMNKYGHSQEFYVGEMAKKSPDVSRVIDLIGDEKIKLLVATALLLVDEPGIDSIHLVVSLSIEQTSRMSEFEKMLQSIDFKVKGLNGSILNKESYIKLSSISVVPSVSAVVYDALTLSTGEPRFPDLIDSNKIGLIYVKHSHTEFLTFTINPDFKPIFKKKIYNTGIASIHLGVKKYFMDSTKTNLTVIQVDEAVKKGVIPFRGVEINLDDKINEFIQIVNNEIYLQVKPFLSDLSTLILAGEGMGFLSGNLIDKLKFEDTRLLPSSSNSCSRGLWSIGLLEQRVVSKESKELV